MTIGFMYILTPGMLEDWNNSRTCKIFVAAKSSIFSFRLFNGMLLFGGDDFVAVK